MPITSSKQLSSAKLWIVSVGVNYYQDSLIPNLKYCANDCEELAEAFTLATKQFKETEIIALHDEGTTPNLESVLASIKKFRLAQPKDTILFYFSGHGELDRDNRPVLGVTDTKVINNEADNSLSFDPETGLRLDRLLEEFRNSPAQSQLIWLDACQAKAEISGEQNNANGQIIAVLNQESQQTRPGKNFFAMLSCDQTERSWEFDELRHGLFTYSLIEGLQGNAANAEGRIGVNSLFEYVKHNIAEYLELKKHLTTEAANNSAKGLVIKPTKQVKRFPANVYQNPRKIDSSGEVDLIIGAVAPANNRKALIYDRLSSSLTDIEFCRLLQDRGGFTVEHCFLEAKTDKNLEESIAGYLQDKDIETVLLYLAGEIEDSDETHSFFQKQSRFATLAQRAVRRKAQGNPKELASHRAHQDRDRAEYSLAVNSKSKVNLNWLSQLIRNSPVKEAIVIVDVMKRQDSYPDIRDILNPDANRSLCIIAASSTQANRKLISQLIEILTVAAEDDKQFWAATMITQLQKKADFPQELRLQKPGLYSSSTAMNILLPKSRRSNKQTYDLNICPYKSLQAFTQDDSYFFHGREALIAEILEKLATNSFLAVVGASGSGKSSVVRAGVIPQLIAKGLYSPQFDEYLPCKTYVMRPGDNPLTALATALASSDPELAEGFLHIGVESFISWLQQQPQTISVLVIDQFEELFTTKHKSQSNNFIEFILQAIALSPDYFKVIITLRDDFLKDCLANQNIDPLFRQSHILVRPYLKEDEYRQILKQPAQKVGLTIEDELVNVLLQELQTESLPLLQFALDELWRKRTSGKLTLANYQENIGGLGAILGKKAESILNSLNKEQQECAQTIFQDLVQLGEGKEDTRRRVSKRKLAKTKHQTVFNSTLKALVDARLLVIGLDNNTLADNAPNAELEDRSREGETTVEIAHEILIRNWDTLRWWLDTNRNQIRLNRELEQKAEEWVNTPKDKKDDFLLSDAELAKYQELYLKYADELSASSNQFVDISIQTRDRDKKLAKRRKRQIIGGLTGVIIAISMVAGAALWQLRRATINEIEALSNSAEILVNSERELDALITGLKAGRKIEKSFFISSTQIKSEFIADLQAIFAKVNKSNYWKGHTNDINSIVFSPDGKTIASASDDKTVKLWNINGKLIDTLSNHTGSIDQVEFSSDGQKIVTVFNTFDFRLDESSKSKDPYALILKIWNYKGQLINTFKSNTYKINNNTEFSPDGNYIAAVDTNKIKLWDTNGKVFKTVEGHSESINSLAFSPDGNTIASASDDKTVKLWNTNGNLLITIDNFYGKVTDVSFGSNEQIIVKESGGNAYLIKIEKDRDAYVDFKIQEFINYGKGFSYREGIAFSPSGKVAASYKGGTIQIWNFKEQLLETINANNFDGEFIKLVTAYSIQEDIIAINSNYGVLTLWNFKGQLLETINVSQNDIRKLFFSSDGQTIITTDYDQNIKLWNTEGNLLNTFKYKEDQSLAFSPNGKVIALWKESTRDYIILNNNNVIELWSIEGELIHTLEGHDFEIDSVKFSPDGKFVVSISYDNTIKLWSMEGKLIRTLEGHNDDANSIEFSPDSKTIVSISDDNTIKLWSIEGELIRTLEGHNACVSAILFGPKGKSIATFTNSSLGLPYGCSEANTINLWNRKGKLIANLVIDDDQYGISDVQYSLDGKTIAATDGSFVKLWNVKGKLLGIFEGHRGPVRKIMFDSGSKKIASGSWDNTIKIWNTNLEDVMSRGCDWVRGYLESSPNVSEEDRKICDGY
ncbi:MAG: caspase family protein [Cyanobacteria bacterium J06643_13]